MAGTESLEGLTINPQEKEFFDEFKKYTTKLKDSYSKRNSDIRWGSLMTCASLVSAVIASDYFFRDSLGFSILYGALSPLSAGVSIFFWYYVGHESATIKELKAKLGSLEQNELYQPLMDKLGAVQFK